MVPAGTYLGAFCDGQAGALDGNSWAPMCDSAVGQPRDLSLEIANGNNMTPQVIHLVLNRFIVFIYLFM